MDFETAERRRAMALVTAGFRGSFVAERSEDRSASEKKILGWT
jgi:hypothetical protein